MTPQRIWWIDCGKALGMFLVFYAHLAKNLYAQSPSPFVFTQIKLIYSFHMLFFFLLSGLVYKSENDFRPFISRILRTRVTPYLFFNCLFAAGYLVCSTLTKSPTDFSLYSLIQILRGHPLYCWMTWFVVCLASTEAIHFAVSRLTKNAYAKATLALVIFGVGIFLSSHEARLPITVEKLLNSYFFREAMVAYLFFYVGAALKPVLSHPTAFDKRSTLAFALGFAVLLLLTFDLNTGPFRDNFSPTVNTNSGEHGNPMLFVITALAGSLSIVAISRLMPFNAILSSIGRNTLSLLALNTLFYHHLNSSLLSLCSSGNHLVSLVACLLVTAASIFVCFPIIFLLYRYCPTMLGKRKPIPAATAK